MFSGKNLQRSIQGGLWMEVEIDKNHLLAKIADNFDWDNVLSALKKFYCPSYELKEETDREKKDNA